MLERINLQSGLHSLHPPGLGETTTALMLWPACAGARARWSAAGRAASAAWAVSRQRASHRTTTFWRAHGRLRCAVAPLGCCAAPLRLVHACTCRCMHELKRDSQSPYIEHSRVARSNDVVIVKDSCHILQVKLLLEHGLDPEDWPAALKAALRDRALPPLDLAGLPENSLAGRGAPVSPAEPA